jgi:osmotically-inducible protein OsmY
MTRLTRFLGVLAATLALTGCTSLREPIVQFLHDSSTTTAIKTRLAMDGRPSTLARIGVETTDDMVRLTGTVADEAERRHVETIARNVAGDNRVINELTVDGNPAAAPRAQKE